MATKSKAIGNTATQASLDATIVIPTYNRKQVVLETLAALVRNGCGEHRWEAIVVDDGSSDGTAGAVAEWAKAVGSPIRVIRQTNRGPASARNCGAEAAKGRMLIFIDNDILVEPDFVSKHLQTLTEHENCWVVGRVVHPPELLRSPFGRYRNAVWEAFHRAHEEAGVYETNGITAANLSLPADHFRRFGGFDEDFTIASSEDWVLGFRARQAGIRILYRPDIKVVHNDWADTLDRFCQRQKMYSISDVLLWRKYGEKSPRAGLVRNNAPVDRRNDPPRLIVKKMLKWALATPPGRFLLRVNIWLAESMAPDSRWNRRSYDAAVAIYIFLGVREGLRRYCGEGGFKPEHRD